MKPTAHFVEGPYPETPQTHALCGFPRDNEGVLFNVGPYMRGVANNTLTDYVKMYTVCPECMLIAPILGLSGKYPGDFM